MKCIVQGHIVFVTLCFLMGWEFITAQDFDTACINPQPFCSDSAQELTFSNSPASSDDLGEVGCLNTTPNPFWRYLKIETSGDFIFEIKQWVDADDDNRLDRNEEELDVDFIAWGPFPNAVFSNCSDELARGCDTNPDPDVNPRPAECENNRDNPDFYTTNLDNTNIVDCSFARESRETFTILNAQSGDYYLILITNFADVEGVVQLDQINQGEENAGTTDCSILNPGLGPDFAVCGSVDFPRTLEGRYPDAIQYLWERASLNSPTVFQPIGGSVPFLEITNDGVYRLTGLDASGTPIDGAVDEQIVVDVSNAIVSVEAVVNTSTFSNEFTVQTNIVSSPALQLSETLNDFQYRLERDLGNGFEVYIDYQSDSSFSGIPPGDYRVIARYGDCESGEVTSDPFMLVGYPKYFTPNGDTVHDTWSLVNVEGQSTALIYIFDKNGKLLKQLQPDGPGWDGTYNGQLMPSSEYWFRVEFGAPDTAGDEPISPRTFKGSFSLIR